MLSEKWLIGLIVRLVRKRICSCEDRSRPTFLPTKIAKGFGGQEVVVSFECEDCDRQYAVHADLKTGEIEWDYSTEKVEEDRELRCGKRMNGGWRCFCGQHEVAEAVAHA